MAIDIVKTLAMSSKPELLVSAAKHTISEQQHGLKADSMNRAVGVRQVMARMRISTMQDIPHIIAAS